MKKTKIIATLGPGTQTEERLVERIENGDVHTKIPVVCNVEGVSELLENGQTVTIDGSTGQISYGSLANQ